MKKSITLVMLLLFIGSDAGWAQDSPRAVIDTLRWGFDYKSAEAYRRARRAQSLDSTYFVGVMMEGFHYYDRAEEQTGLRRAIPPLREAIRLFEADFGQTLNRRYTRLDIQRGAWQDLLRQLDYLTITSTLVECYSSLEMADSTYRALMRLRDSDLAFDFRSYQGLAWLYFRSRVYNSSQYAFLHDTIEDNLRQAFLYTDSLQARYEKNKPYLRRELLGAYAPGSGFHDFFERAFIEQPLGSIANTLGILYGYNFEPRKAANYFSKMDDEENLAKMVNLGYTYHSAIDFRRSEEFFSRVPDRGSKSRGGHWQGFSSLFVFKGEPMEGAALLADARDRHGFTIGYGWDNLCLARMYLYAGMLDEADASLNKAEKFSEVHFNTSFREDQYRFMLKTLRLLHDEFKSKSLQFEHRNKWLSRSWWAEALGLLVDRVRYLYTLANEMALNPEREIVYYHIFHTESIITFDELWRVVRNYSNDFFKSTFEEKMSSDPRSNLGRYYHYFIARLLLEEGSEEAAYDRLAAILADPGLDRVYEKLLIGRIHETCALIADEKGWLPQREFHLNQLYESYPQLIPFSDAQMVLRLEIDPLLRASGEAQVEAMLEQLLDCNVNWEGAEEENVPLVRLFPEEAGRVGFEVIYSREVLRKGSVNPARPDSGKELAYRLFDIYR